MQRSTSVALKAQAGPYARLPSVRHSERHARQEDSGFTDALRLELSHTISNIRDQGDRFFKKYDVLSTAMGAMLVTGYFTSKGQDIGTALAITGWSTIVALVVNELIVSNQQQQ